MTKNASLVVRLRLLVLVGLRALAFVLLFASVLCSQKSSTNKESVSRLMEQFRKEPFAFVASQLADANAVEAIPLLKQAFGEIKVDPSDNAFLNDDLSNKGGIAVALVRLGEKTGPHWDFLIAQARIAVESDAPYPVPRDVQGNEVKDQLSQEFLAWAQARSLSPENEARNQIAMMSRLIHLAALGDVRGLSLVRKAIVSPNPLVQVTGANGLAILQDKSSIPLIVRACESAPADVAALLARSLVFFDDPAAQKAAGRFIEDERFLESLREKYRLYGPRGVYR